VILYVLSYCCNFILFCLLIFHFIIFQQLSWVRIWACSLLHIFSWSIQPLQSVLHTVVCCREYSSSDHSETHSICICILGILWSDTYLRFQLNTPSLIICICFFFVLTIYLCVVCSMFWNGPLICISLILILVSMILDCEHASLTLLDWCEWKEKNYLWPKKGRGLTILSKVVQYGEGFLSSY